MVISRENLEVHMINMKNHVEGKLAELGFDINKVGFSDWDAESRKNSIPFSVAEETVRYAFSADSER
jgi:hypothetical protein